MNTILKLAPLAAMGTFAAINLQTFEKYKDQAAAVQNAVNSQTLNKAIKEVDIMGMVKFDESWTADQVLAWLEENGWMKRGRTDITTMGFIPAERGYPPEFYATPEEAEEAYTRRINGLSSKPNKLIADPLGSLGLIDDGG